ncbi:MAG: GNAT family N-acetyltransferase [Bacteroidetes bacterium]|nr:GNAT family N-acetyltransferase [Bacteroidota bacterium]
MKLKLEPIKINEDITNKDFQSEDCQTLLNMWQDYYPKIGFNLPWVGYFVKRDTTIVGTCAFTGPPVDNKVEVSYWTFKEFEGQGISTTACKELIKIATSAQPNIIVIAKTAPEKKPSTSILKKCGFTFTGIVQDHEIGDAWEWTCKP